MIGFTFGPISPANKDFVENVSQAMENLIKISSIITNNIKNITKISLH